MSSRIKISQAGLAAGVAGRSRTDGLATGALVTLEDVSGGGDGTSTFHLLWGPPDDTTAESSLAVTGDLDIWTFSPQASRYGSYLIELRVNGVPRERRIFGIRTPANGLLIPALNERASRHANWTNEGADQIELSEQNANDFPLSVLNNFRYAGYWRSLYELYRIVEFGTGSIADNALALAKLVQAASAPSVIGALSNGNFGEIPVATLAASESARGFVELASAAEANALSDTVRAVSPGRLPIASLTQQGLVELATAVEANALTDAARSITPATLPIASDTQQGLVERATAAECNALSDTTRFVTPGRIPIASLTQQGVVELATLAEAQALTDAVRAITPATLPTSSTTQAGITRYATAAEQETATAADRAVTPSVQHRHPGACKAWIKFGGTNTNFADYNCDTVTNNASGDYTITLTTAMSSADYACVTGIEISGDLQANLVNTAVRTMAAGSVRIKSWTDVTQALTNVTSAHFAVFGDM